MTGPTVKLIPLGGPSVTCEGDTCSLPAPVELVELVEPALDDDDRLQTPSPARG